MKKKYIYYRRTLARGTNGERFEMEQVDEHYVAARQKEEDENIRNRPQPSDMVGWLLGNQLMRFDVSGPIPRYAPFDYEKRYKTWTAVLNEYSEKLYATAIGLPPVWIDEDGRLRDADCGIIFDVEVPS